MLASIFYNVCLGWFDANTISINNRKAYNMDWLHKQFHKSDYLCANE
jgi:hypothetical protein